MHDAADPVASLVPRLEQALRENPQQAELHAMFGIALHAAGRFDDATEAFERALALQCECAPALDGLGVILQSMGEYEAAIPFHERSITSDPKSARSRYNYGNALLRLGRYPEAREAIMRSLEIDPAFAEAHNGLGAVHQETGELEEAIACYRRAITCKPTYGLAACNLGNVLREAGDLSEAIYWFERAITIDPKNGRFQRYLVDTRPEVDGPHLRSMERIAKSIHQLSVEQRIEWHFALGKVYTDIGRYEQAFAYLREGNALKRSQIDYNEIAHLDFINGAQRTFSREFVDAFSGGGNPTESPIFIVGMPRSGSTLVEQILAAHPSVRAMGELDAFEHVFGSLPQLGAHATQEEVRASIRELADRYLSVVGAEQSAALRITDKTLGNFRYVPLIHLAFPNARIIDVRRDALDTCWSCYATLFVNPMPFAFDLAELGRYRRLYESYMSHCRSVVPADRLLQLDYEQLVDDFEAQARRLIAFCGLPWDEACLEFHRVRRPIRTASHSQVRQPLYRTSVGRARHFQPYLTPLIEELSV